MTDQDYFEKLYALATSNDYKNWQLFWEYATNPKTKPYVAWVIEHLPKNRDTTETQTLFNYDQNERIDHFIMETDWFWNGFEIKVKGNVFKAKNSHVFPDTENATFKVVIKYDNVRAIFSKYDDDMGEWSGKPNLSINVYSEVRKILTGQELDGITSILDMMVLVKQYHATGRI